MSPADRRPPAPTEHGWSFEETERRQWRAGLDLTPLERLRWLDRRKKELQALLGRAQPGRLAQQDEVLAEIESFRAGDRLERDRLHERG